MTTATIPQQAARLAEQAKSYVNDLANWREDDSEGLHEAAWQSALMTIAALVTLITAESLRLDWLLARHTERGSKLIGLGFYPDKQEQRRMIQMAIDAGTCVVDEVDAIEVRKVRLDEARDAARWRTMRERFVSVDWDWNENGIAVACFEIDPTLPAFSGPECADSFADCPFPTVGAAMASTPASPQAPAPSAATATALEQERAKFQQETRRTSELSRLLKRWIDRHEAEHGPGPWAKSCEVCALVGESNALLARPINDPAPSAAPHQGADALREALIVEMRAQIQHLVDDLCDSTIDDFGLQRYVPKQTLMFHNMVAALVRWSESAALAQHQAPQQTAPQALASTPPQEAE